MEARFEQYPASIKEFLSMLETMIEEEYASGQRHQSDKCTRMDLHAQQETFILANQLRGDDPDPQKVFVTRLVLPILQTLMNVQENIQKKKPDHLKHILVHAENIHITNLLEFLGYWDTYGYQKNTQYASSVQIELARISSNNVKGFYVQFTYDGEIMKFAWCDNQTYCPIDTFIEYAAANVLLDFDYVNEFCQGTKGINYLAMTKPEKMVVDQ